MNFRSFLTLTVFFMTSSFSLDIDKVDSNDRNLISKIKNIHFERILSEKSNVLPENQIEKETYLESLWHERLKDLENNHALLIHAHHQEESLCALFLYPSDLTYKDGYSEHVLVNVGLVLLTNDKSKIPAAINAITHYEIENYPECNFLSYMPKDQPAFKAIFDSQGYKEKSLEEYTLGPINHLKIFPTEKFSWFVRELEL